MRHQKDRHQPGPFFVSTENRKNFLKILNEKKKKNYTKYNTGTFENFTKKKNLGREKILKIFVRTDGGLFFVKTV